MPRLTNPPTSTSVQTAPWVLVPSKHARWPRLLLTPGGHAVGTGAGMTVRLEAAGLAECHAIVQVAEDGVTLEACDPRTWINDGVVRRSKLRLGDRVTLGPCTWTVRSAETDDLLAGWPAPVEVAPPTDSGHRLTFDPPRAEVVPGPVSTTFTEPSAAIRDESEESALDTTRADRDSSDETAQSTSVSQEDFEATVDPLVTLDQAEGLLARCASADVEPCADQPDRPCATGSASGLPGEHSPNTFAHRSLIDTAQATSTPSVHELLKLHDELQGLRHDLARARAAWREETQRRELELVAESTQLTRRAAAIERIEHELNRRTLELDAEHSSLTRRDGELHQTELRLQELQRELIAERQRLESLAAETQRQLQLETDQQVVAWEECRQSQQRLLAELAGQTSDLEARQAQWRADRAALAEDQRELEQARHDMTRSRHELDAERTAFAQERSAWETRCREREATHLEHIEQLRQQQATLNTEIHARAEAQAEMLAAQQTLHHDRRLFAEQQLDWQQERETLWQDLTDRKRRLDRETDELESTRRQIDALQQALEVELDEAKRLARSVSADTALLMPLEPLTDTPPSSETSAGTIEDAATDPSISQDFDAVQAALEALAERFEEFSELEQRLSNKHDELRDLQQDLAVREAALATETEAWRQEHEAWQTAVAEDAAQRAAWQAERDFATRELAEERRRWADHLQQLGRLATVEPIQDAPSRITWPSSNPVAETMVETVSEDAPVDSRSREAPTGAWDDDGVLSEPSPTCEHPSEFPAVDDGSSVTEDEPTAWRSFEDVIAAEAEWLPATEQALATGDEQELTSQEVPEAPFEDAEGAARWPMGLSSIADVEPQNALTETGETTSASAPPASEVNLRAELARMFNLPNDFAEHPHDQAADSENAESDPDVEVDDSTSLAAALEQSIDDAVADQASSHEDESWRDRLSELLNAKAEAAPEPIAEPEPTPAPVAESLSSFETPPAAPVNDERDETEEDSIAAYMARMLARNRRGGDDEPEPVTVTSREPERRSAAPVSSPVTADVEVEPARREPSTPRKKIDKDATRAELQSFRQVANLSARTALAKHTWRTTKTELTIQTTLAGLCTVGGIAYAIAPFMGSPFALGPTIGCWLGAGFIGWRASRTLRKLRQWTGSTQDSAVTPGSDSDGPDESVIAEALPPSEDNTNV